jgi:hypothetical protein
MRSIDIYCMERIQARTTTQASVPMSELWAGRRGPWSWTAANDKNFVKIQIQKKKKARRAGMSEAGATNVIPQWWREDQAS